MLMERFIPGALVCSNDLYYKDFGRRVTGKIVRPTTYIDDDSVIVRWVTQEGENFNPKMENQMVLMKKKYLEIKQYL